MKCKADNQEIFINITHQLFNNNSMFRIIVGIPPTRNHTNFRIGYYNFRVGGKYLRLEELFAAEGRNLERICDRDTLFCEEHCSKKQDTFVFQKQIREQLSMDHTPAKADKTSTTIKRKWTIQFRILIKNNLIYSCYLPVSMSLITIPVCIRPQIYPGPTPFFVETSRRQASRNPNRLEAEIFASETYPCSGLTSSLIVD
ncbi:2699_t:CDS:2 [Funneliformis mosseae]|uniref:2699_t:CDS:1 n=1 Tax=Funneliformis mosseae TaxID=27381 RepID=A0A9N9BX32_FUNMO|nr:2699_t:CDS:2 [Funneliformis mosseae]